MNRLWLRTSAVLLCLVQLTAAAQYCRADERGSGEKLLPKETLFFFSIEDVPEFKTKWDKTSIGQMLHDPQLKPFLDEVSEHLDEGSKKIEDEVGVSLHDLLDLGQGELTLALMEQPLHKLAVVLLLEYGDKQETVDKLLKKMGDELKKEDAEHSTEEVNDVTLHIYKLKTGDDNPINTLAYFSDESCLVFSNEVEALKEVLERWDGSSEDTLAQNEAFSYIQAQCKMESGDPALKIYLSPIGLINSGISVAQQSFPQAGMALGFLPMLGVDSMKGWGTCVDFGEGDYEALANSYFYCDSSKGLMGAFSFPATQLTPPKWVPASVGSYVGTNWDFAAAYKSIETLVDSFQGRGSTARFLEQQASQPPNIHIKKDILDLLDGKIHVIQGSVKEAKEDAPPIPEFFVALGLKDAAKMKKTLAAAAKSGGSNMETREFNGETIYEIKPPGNDNDVSVAITEGLLVITNDTPMIEGMMRGKSGQRNALADSADYKKIAKSFPAKTSMISFQRSESQLKVYYDLLKNSNVEQLHGLDVSKLPPFEKLAKYFQPSGGYSVPDKKGSKTVSFTLKRD